MQNMKHPYGTDDPPMDCEKCKQMSRSYICYSCKKNICDNCTELVATMNLIRRIGKKNEVKIESRCKKCSD